MIVGECGCGCCRSGSCVRSGSSGGRRFGGRRFIIIEATVGLKELAVLGEFAEVSLPDVLAGRHVDVLVRPNEDQHLSGLRVLPREARF